MVKASKKLVALLLTLTMVVAMAGCGNKEKGTDTNATPTVAASTEATTTPVPTEPSNVTKNDDYTAFDLGGRTIKVGIWWDYYYDSDNQDINDDPKLSNTETAQMKLDNVRRIEEKYNCKIDFVNLGWNGIINSINTTIAAGTPECDVYLTDLQFGMTAALSGLCQNLDDLVLEGNDLFGKQSVIQPLTGMQGGTYFFTEQGIPLGGYYIGYNKTMIQDLGLEDPQELWNNGQWTWDKFEELAKAGTQDTNKDGATDVYGYGGVWTDLVNGIVLNNGGAIAAGSTQTLDSPEVQASLEFISKLYNDDKCARPWNADDWNDNLLAWSSGKVMMWTAQAWLNRQEMDAAAENGGELPFDFGMVPYPQGPSGDGTPYTPVHGNWYMIPVGVEDGGKVLQVMEEFFNWFDGDVTYRDDPTWFESCFQTEEDVNIAIECGSNLKLDLWGYLSPYYDLGSTVWAPLCVDKSQTVAQAIEAAKPTLQSALDYFYSQK